MARLEKLSNTKWKQYFRDRKKDFRLWSTHKEVAEYCEIYDGTQRLLKVEFEQIIGLILEHHFTITSGQEIRFPKDFQVEVKKIVLNHPESYFTVEVLDINEESAENGALSDIDSEFIEGKKKEKKHISRERNSKLVKAKKETVRLESGNLSCEICGFDFENSYGDLGHGFIECHHLIPLSKLNETTKTRLSDLALVCSNCHRMAHRHIAKDPTASSVIKLKKALKIKSV